MDPFAVNWAYYILLKQAIPGKPVITSVEEIDTVITIFTSAIKSAKNRLKTIKHISASRLGHSRSRGTIAKKHRSEENMHSLNRAVDCKQCNFLKDYMHTRLKHSKIRGSGKDTEDASTINDIQKITKRFTKQKTQLHTPLIHGRKELTYTPLEKASAISEVYEEQFRSKHVESNIDNSYQ
jgi:hypothetical protein